MQGFHKITLTTTVSMNGLSSSCVLATTAVPTATSAHVRRWALGGLIRLDPLPTGATCIRLPATSTPGITIGVASALLCAAETKLRTLTLSQGFSKFYPCFERAKP